MPSFAPTVSIDGQTYTPPGWMWILAFALRGVPWAVEIAETEEFRQTIREWHRKRYIASIKDVIAELELELWALRRELEEAESMKPG